jgi:beta-lactamase class A
MNIRTISITGGVFLLGLMMGGVFSSWEELFSQVDKIEHSKQVRQVGEYRYTNPLLECEVAEGTIDAKKQNFQDALEKKLEQIKTERKLTEVAVYFRDLNNGPAFGIDESGEFFPASLLKVPVMMAYLRWSEQEPGLLERGVVYEQARDFGVTVAIRPREEMEPGKTYSVEELIRRMIIFSDNQALALLTARLPRERIHELFGLLGIGEDVLVDAQGRLTVKEYAGFFRILFNSSYLSRENSEKALLLLASTDFNDALPAGIPAGVPVAHKFGEAGRENQSVSFTTVALSISRIIPISPVS